MSLVNSSFTVNVTPGAMPPTIHVSEYDIGRTYTVTINGENGSAFNIPTGTTATVEGTLNGVTGFTTNATISGSTISFTLTESMTAKSGKAWCKIKLTLNNEPIQTCAFVLAVDRAGVEADTVIGADGFEQQIVNAVNDWLDEHPPASGGMSEAFKQALLDCFENVAWINDDGQTYYDALYAALYPPADVLSISAVFTQGSAVIYDTDGLDTLKQYLVVTATMTDSTTQTLEDTDYTLSGTLTVGTSTITVSYGGKTTTFNVTVTAAPPLPLEYQEVEWIGSTGTQLLEVGISFSSSSQADYEMEAEIAVPEANASTAVLMCTSSEGGYYLANVSSGNAVGISGSVYFSNLDVTQKHQYVLTWNATTETATCEGQSITRARITQEIAKPSFFGDYEKLYLAKCRIYSAKVRHSGNEIRDLIPCYRKSDSVIGMYDIANNIFYTNSGTGTFTKGSDVS